MGKANRWLAILAVTTMLIGCASGVKQKVSVAPPPEAITPPTAAEIKAQGLGNNFELTSFDEVWDALLVVVMQNARIFHVSKKDGLIATAKVNIFVENAPGKADTVTVFIASPVQREAVAKDLFTKVSTQLYAQKKWKYFQKEKG